MKKMFLVLFMAVMITAISACGTETPSASSTISSTDSSVKATDTSSATETAPATETASATDVNTEGWTKIGKTVTVEDIQYTVNGFKNTKGSKILPPEEGKTYILTDITVKNDTKEEAIISSIMMFYLTDADGKEYDTSLFGGMMGLEAEKLEQLDVNVAAGIEKRGGIGFEIPENAKGLTLVIKEAFGDGNQKVKLN
ncbi:MAG: DUF4352 domain-containing protein [Ruminiclostridium sp.]